MKITLFPCSFWWLSHAPWLILLVRPPTTWRLQLAGTVHESEEEEREAQTSQRLSVMTMSGLAAEASLATSLSRGGWKTCVTESVCVFACITLCVRRKIEDRERVQESVIQRASVYSPRLSITLDSRGPFRLAVNHGPALPAHRLEAQDKPTAELHPVYPSSTAHSSATMGHSSHFSLREDPVCQSG